MTDMAVKEELREQLARVEPSVAERGVRLYPCSAQLKNGTVLSCLYLLGQADFLRLTGFQRPDDAGERLWISPEDLVSIQESPMRLPAKFANQLYEAGESGMGYKFFTVVFSWWCRREYLQSRVDFIRYPPGTGPSKVKSVLPHTGRRDAKVERIPEPVFYWCVFSE
jgi:hypothetical protein